MTRTVKELEELLEVKSVGELMEWTLVFSSTPGSKTFEMFPAGYTMDEAKKWIDHKMHIMAMYECDGNQSEMARRLGLSRETVRRRCNEYCLHDRIHTLRKHSRRRKRDASRSRGKVRGGERVRVQKARRSLHDGGKAKRTVWPVADGDVRLHGM